MAILFRVAAYLCLLILLIPLTGVGSLCAQTGRVGNPPRWWLIEDKVFQHLASESGLPSNAVTAMAEDAQGFIWVGTQNGLARWDGYRFRNYLHQAQDKFSLPDNFIIRLFRDQSGVLWIGTKSGGLVFYDVLHDRFEPVALGPQVFNHAAILSIIDDGQRGLFIGTERGLYQRLANGKALPLGALNKSDAARSPEVVFNLLRDNRQQLWVASSMGLLRRDAKTQALVEQPFTRPDGEFLRVGSMLSNRAGQVWLGTAKQGLFLLNPANAHLEAVQDSANQVHLEQDEITALLEVAPGQLWISTDLGGVVILDLASSRMRRVQLDPALPGGLASMQISSLLRDRSGSIWVGHDRGLSRYHPNENALHSLPGSGLTPNHLAGPGGHGLREMPDGSIWVGLLKNGLNFIDPKLESISLFRPAGPVSSTSLFPELSLPQPYVPMQGAGPMPWSDQIGSMAPVLPIAPLVAPGWPPAIVENLTPPFREKMYFSSMQGLFQLDIKQSTVSHIKLSPFPLEPIIRALQVDGDRLWVGGQGGMLGLDMATLGTQVRPVVHFAGDDVVGIEVGRDGVLWISTFSHGLFRFWQKTRERQHINPEQGPKLRLPGNTVPAMLIDSRGWLWVGTLGDGIHLFKNPNAVAPQIAASIGVAEGLPNAVIYKLLEDKHGHIWVSTEAGLARIEPQTLAVEALRRADGASSSGYLPGSGTALQNGELIFGAADGLTVVQPERYQRWAYRPPVVITRLQIGNQDVLATGLNQAGAMVEIPAQANSFAVEFAALDFTAPERNRYSYWLEGYDQDWMSTDANKRLASYTNLAPGQYRLRLRGSNRQGQFSEQERILKIQVLPAWYQTWWFRLGLMLGLAGLVYALVQGRTRYLRRRQWVLEREVEQRTGQLREAQAQLVQQEKLASLGGVVSGIAHEINTPLGTALLALSGIAGIWKQLKQALGDGNLTKTMLDNAAQEGDEYTVLALASAGRAADLVTIFKTIAVQVDQHQPEDIDLALYLPEVASLIHAQLEQSGSQIRFEIAPHFIIRAPVDALTAALTRILANVPDHAFIDLRQGELLVRAGQEGDDIVIEIRDNGQGIEASALPRVFDPFFTTRSGSHGHIGLGLHVAYNHVTQGLQGSLVIESVAGQGTCVRVRFKPVVGGGAA